MRDFEKWRRGRLPIPVNYEGKSFGKVTKEVAVAEYAGNDIDYIKLIQFIEDAPPRHGKEPWVRFAYYRRMSRDGDWVYGSQWTLTISKSYWKKLHRKAKTKGIL